MRFLLIAATGLALLGGGCSSHSTHQGNIGPAQPTSTIPGAHTDAAVSGPSADARFVCSKRAASDLALLLGGRAVKVVNPVWFNGQYTCEYMYVEQASVMVSVKEFATLPDASRYFDQRHLHLRDIDTAADCREYCYVTRNGLALLRNGAEVLFVDASRLPSTSVGMSRADNALSVLGAVIPP